VLSLRLCGSLEVLPAGIGQLKNLSCLHCSGCGFELLPLSIGDLQNLKQLDLSFCSHLKEVPPSLGGASQLEYLSVAGCSMLKSLPSSISYLFELVSLSAAGCCGVSELPALWPRKLQLLDLQGCENLTSFPSGVCDLPHLEALFLQGCTGLEQFPSSGLPSLRAVGLPLLTQSELQHMGRKGSITSKAANENPGFTVRGKEWYLANGKLNREWLKAVEGIVEWLPWGAQYRFYCMKKFGRQAIDIKAAMEGTMLEDESGGRGVATKHQLHSGPGATRQYPAHCGLQKHPEHCLSGNPVAGTVRKLKGGGALYNCWIMAFLEVQIEKLHGMQKPNTASAKGPETVPWDSLATELSRELKQARRLLAKHTEHFDVRDFYSSQDARCAVEVICSCLKDKIRNWSLDDGVCIEHSVPAADVLEDKKMLDKLLSYILKDEESDVDQELLQRWEPFKQRHRDNMKLVPVIDEDALKLGETLGSGGQGTVFEAVWISAPVAVKMPSKVREGCLSIESYAGLVKEAMEHAVLNSHPNVIRLLATTTSGWLVLELANYDLHTLCHDMGVLSWRCKARLLQQGAASLEHIHYHKWVHGDIKPRNFLLVGTQPEALQLKISDFGLSFEEVQSRSKTVRGGGGTEVYVAPESYDNKPIDQKSDVYSFGVVCYEIISQKKPFANAASQYALMAMKCRGAKPCPVNEQDCPPGVLELVSQCCAAEPAERPTMVEVSKRLSQLSKEWSAE